MIELSEQGKISEKVFGKNKFYFASQNQYGEIKEEELNKLDEEIEELKDKSGDLHDEVTKLESEVNALQNAPSTEDLEKTVDEMTIRIQEKKERLDHLMKTQEEIPPETHDNLIKELKKYTKLWKERKDKLTEFLSSMEDGLEKSKDEIYEMMGIEDDTINIKEIKEKYLS